MISEGTKVNQPAEIGLILKAKFGDDPLREQDFRY